MEKALAWPLGKRLGRVGVFSLAMVCRLPLDGSPLFIVIPGFKQEKRKWIRTVVVLPVNTHGFVQRFPTSTLNVAIEAPFGSRVVEPRPCPSNRNFVGVLVLHRVIEILEVLLAPITAIGRPSAGAGLNPRIRSRKIIGKLCCRLVLVDQQWWPIPTAAVLAHPVPINVPTLGEDED